MLFAVLGGITGASGCDTRQAPSSGDLGLWDGTSRPVDAGAAPSGCSYEAEAECYRCGSGRRGVVIGCQALGDCRVFCSRDFPAGYAACSSGAVDSQCPGWLLPKPPLSWCVEVTSAHSPQYSCPACGYDYSMGFVHTRGPDGVCTGFLDGCVAAGFEYDASCAP